MAIDTDELVRLIHQSATPMVMAVTGGGSRAISDLLAAPGASRTVLEATVPYAPEALTAWLGSRPEYFCSAATASAMAMIAFLRAQKYVAQRSESASTRVVGIAATASLASDRVKRGPHRAHIAWQTASVSGVLSLELQKGKRSRSEEETIVAGLVLNAAARVCGVTERLTPNLLPGEEVETKSVEAPPEWQELLSGASDAARHGPHRSTNDRSEKVGIYSGAFNPLHAGHRRIAEVGSRRLAYPIAFETSIINVDKPPLDFLAMDSRLKQFSADDVVWFTRAATFVEKAAIFPRATFLVGVDTMVRIADPKYYGSADDCLAAIRQIAARGCRFLVFGRKRGASFQTLSDLQLPTELSAVCDEVPAEEFREDISSTELRQRCDPDET